MSRALCLKLQPDAALAVVVRGGATLTVERVVRIPLSAGNDAKARGRVIAAALAELKLGRAPTVLAIPRTELSVQNYDLPPVPADDLPDLVHLQAQRDLPLADDGEGFDFLPLAGDESHPYRVLGVGVMPATWKLLRETCEAADLKLDRIVPESLGWPELGRRALEGSDGADALTLFAAIVDRHAAVWATEGAALRLLRSVWLPEDDNAAADAAALGGELRRTLLSLAQSHLGEQGGVKCVYIGVNADEIAGELGATLSKPVQAAPLERLVDLSGAEGADGGLLEVAPLAALAAAVAERRPTPIDLLHPRRRPPPPSRARTYSLAGAAALAGVAMIAWQGYRNIQAPLEAAEAARAERTALEPILNDLAADEAKAAAIRTWVGASVNLLTEMDYLALQLRPEALDSEKFQADKDLVLTKLTLVNRQLTFDAAARTRDAFLPAESRLRTASYWVDRGVEESNAQAVPGHGASVTVMIERVEAAPAPAEGAAP